jgi:hypothetical protein
MDVCQIHTGGWWMWIEQAHLDLFLILHGFRLGMDTFLGLPYFTD